MGSGSGALVLAASAFSCPREQPASTKQIAAITAYWVFISLGLANWDELGAESQLVKDRSLWSRLGFGVVGFDVVKFGVPKAS
jgi:hypothetical protein